MKLNWKISLFLLVIIGLMLSSCGSTKSLFPPTQKKTLEKLTEFYSSKHPAGHGQIRGRHTFSFPGGDKQTRYVVTDSFVELFERRLIIRILKWPPLEIEPTAWGRPRPWQVPLPPCELTENYVKEILAFYLPEFDGRRFDSEKITETTRTIYKDQSFLIKQEVILNYKDEEITVRLVFPPYQ